MKIFIYEDEQFYANQLKTIISNYSLYNNVMFEVFHFSKIEDFMNANNSTDIIINIIDIVNKNTNSEDGIMLSKLIKQQKPNTYIIFFTSHSEYLQYIVDSFIEPISYINKSDNDIPQKFYDVFDEIIKRKMNITMKHFFDYYNDSIYINLNDIHFVKPSKKQKYLNIYTYDKVYEVKGKLTDFIQLTDFLIQTSKSTVVNKHKIVSTTKGTNNKNRIINTNLSNKEYQRLCIITNSFKTNLF